MASYTYGSIQQGEREASGSLSNKTHAEQTPLISPTHFVTVTDGNNGSSFVAGRKDDSSSDRSLWTRLTFRWFTPILHQGNDKKRLDQEDLDLVPLPADCGTDQIADRFDAYWQEELKRREYPSLVRALLRAFGADYLQAGFLKLVHDLCLFVGPQVLHGMIVFLRDPDSTLWKGLALTLAVTLSQLTMSLCLRHYFFKCYTTGLKIRTAIVISVYRKALLLSSSERQNRTLGEITNLMSIDAQRLQGVCKTGRNSESLSNHTYQNAVLHRSFDPSHSDLTTYLHSIWSSPVQISLALVFLFRQLGPSSLGGVSIIIIMIPVTKGVAQWMGSMQKILMKAKDRRVELNGEVLSGMKVIKFQAWEESFQKRILALREVELKQLLRYYIGTSFSRALWVVTPLMVALATFAAYVWTGHQLDVASALTALALFEILRFPLFMLPQSKCMPP